MKIAILSFMFFLAACAVTPTHHEVSSLDYDKVLSFKIGISSESDVVKTFGLPSIRVEENGYYTLIYNDPKTDSQRLSVNIHTASRKISSLLWIPKPEDKQLSIMEAKADFINAKFREVLEASDNPHSFTEAILFVDEKAGVTIRYDKTNDVVEAIALYDVVNRIPAASPKKDIKVRYTIGEGPSNSK